MIKILNNNNFIIILLFRVYWWQIGYGGLPMWKFSCTRSLKY